MEYVGVITLIEYSKLLVFLLRDLGPSSCGVSPTHLSFIRTHHCCGHANYSAAVINLNQLMFPLEDYESVAVSIRRLVIVIEIFSLCS